jgi:hypothetical protein
MAKKSNGVTGSVGMAEGGVATVDRTMEAQIIKELKQQVDAVIKALGLVVDDGVADLRYYKKNKTAVAPLVPAERKD